MLLSVAHPETDLCMLTRCTCSTRMVDKPAPPPRQTGGGCAGLSTLHQETIYRGASGLALARHGV